MSKSCGFKPVLRRAARPPVRVAAERLESRLLLSFGPAGPEFRVNTTTAGVQGGPAVATDADGDFVVTWIDGRDGGEGDVYARRYGGDQTVAPAVVARHVFYNNSFFDGGAAANAADDASVAADKRALLPGQAASFANVTSYSRGINGVMVDVADFPQGAVLTADDFDIGGAGTPPATVRIRRGAGVNGSDRVTLTWADYNVLTNPAAMAVGNGWLTVTVKANVNTGLAASDVFSFGNLIGETGDGTGSTRWRVSALDLAAVKRALNTAAAATAVADFNRDGRVNALDLATVRANLNRSLPAPATAVAGLVSPFHHESTSPVRQRTWDDGAQIILWP